MVDPPMTLMPGLSNMLILKLLAKTAYQHSNGESGTL